MTECAPTHETAEDHALLTESAAPVKFARAAAIEVARELLAHVSPCAERVLIAGSLRRRKAMVGDVELLFIPRLVAGDRCDLLAPPPMVSMVDAALERLLAAGVIARRLSVKGTPSWGAKNKLAVHVASGIPVDLFAATAANWWNYVVCRTGGSRSNIAICNAARERGWKWRPYAEGFTRVGGPDHGRVRAMAIRKIPAGVTWKRKTKAGTVEIVRVVEKKPKALPPPKAKALTHGPRPAALPDRKQLALL